MKNMTNLKALARLVHRVTKKSFPVVYEDDKLAWNFNVGLALGLVLAEDLLKMSEEEAKQVVIKNLMLYH